MPTEFTPWTALAGGALIGLAATVLLASLGRIAGISGLFNGALEQRGDRAFACETTIGEQKRSNIHVHDGTTLEQFVEMRETRDASLDMPTLILPAVQTNIRAGELPEPESNGVRYLKLPLNQF